MLIILLLVSCAGKKEVKTEEVFDPDKSFSRAIELIDKKEYEEARRTLLEVKNRDLTKKYAPAAQLKIADSYMKEEEYDLAVEELKRFLDIYPDHKDASYAQFQIASAYFVRIESHERGYGAASKALEEFEKLKLMFPRNPYREIIDLRIERCKSIIADYGFSVAEFYVKKGSCNAAIGRFNQVITSFPEYKKEPQVLFNMALCYKKLGDRAKAAEYFDRLIKKYPDDKLVKEAKKEAQLIYTAPRSEVPEKSPADKLTKEAKKEVSQTPPATPRSEVPEKAPADKLTKEAKKEAQQTPPATPRNEVPESDVGLFVEQYRSAYESGDIERFMSLYSKSAVENGMRFDDIRRSYHKNFEAGRYTYALRNQQALKSGDYVALTGIFNIKKKGQDRIVTEGNIRWILVKEDAGLKIVKVEY
ncbi:MAG TPA: outer membrane protein assembly factor BamD [Thermodesulfovibrionales bacterium]|nr:outer membrane protein assembly factor BamD [Thermodesulfovibrionales bacterium]